MARSGLQLPTLRRVVSPTGGTASKQLYFAVSMVVLTGLIALSRHELVLTREYLSALGVLALATALSAAVPWGSLRAGWAAVVPVLDIAAIALLRDLLRGDAIAISLLVLLPTVWLAGRLRGPGVAVATLCTFLMISVPSLLRATEIDSLTIAHTVLLPFTVLQIGMLIVGSLRLLDGRNQQLRTALAEKGVLLEEAAASEQLLKNVLDSVGVGIVVVDQDGHDVLMNRAQQRIHQLSAPPDDDDPDETQLLLRYPGSAMPLPAEQRPVRRAVRQETYSNYLVSVGPPGVEGATFSASARQVLDHRGARAGAVVVFSDVTSYFETVRSQERFLAAVSHELRTPLTSVIGYLDLVRDDPALPERAAARLEVAGRNAEQLQLLVQDLLADQVARAGSERLTLRPHRLSDLATRVVEDFALQAEKKGITLIRQVERTPEQLLDASRLQQAVGNLLSNALKYTPTGGTVTVHTCARENEVELTVSDTGIGMTDQEQASLFTDYYRTETARDSHIPGHGIGLALTRRLVVSHGGEISVRSRPDGGGSTFTLRFSRDQRAPADGAAG